jgi:ATP/maltotriose-dependent transcriptional regulator MalT/DNA-binding SARP family transcriptional activator
MKRPVSLSKTTRPTPPGVIARERLFTLLDRRRRAPVVWVSGPPGSGKTTLISSYLESKKLNARWYQLDKDDSDVATFFYYMAIASGGGTEETAALPMYTREYHGDLGAFCRSFFGALFLELKPPFVIALDNYQEVSRQSRFHEVLLHAVSELPPEGCIVVISRTDPPASMVRLRAGRQIENIGWADLQLKRRESDAIINRWHPDLSKAALKQLYEKTEGWAAGLVLLLDQAQNEGFLERIPSLAAPQLVFDYLAGEVFDNFNASTQQFLLKTAYLPEMTVSSAESLTESGETADILGRLHREHYFVALKTGGTEPVYMYHPLLRAFLQQRSAERMDDDTRRDLRRRSARLLEEQNAIALAADVLRDGGDYEAFLPLVLSHAAEMLRLGRAESLERWLDEVPEDLADDDPWFHYWRGSCLFLQSSLRESRHAYERAFELFESRQADDPRGLILTCSGVMDAILHELDDLSLLDRWIAVVDKIFNENEEVVWPEVRSRITVSMFMALVFRQPGRDDISRWAEKAINETENIDDTFTRLTAKLFVAINLNYTGQFARARDLTEHLRKLCSSPRVPPLAQTVLKDVESMYFLLNADHEQCLRAVYDGIEIGRQCGVQTWSYHLLSNGVASALGAGDLETAETLLGEMQEYTDSARRLDRSIYHYYAAWHAMLADDPLRAYREQKIALRLATETGCPFYEILCRLALALVLAETGEERRAASELRKVRAAARSIDNRLLEFMCLTTYAYIALEHRRERSGVAALRYAMGLGREYGFRHFIWWLPKVMAKLCERALEYGIETDYVRDLVRERRLVSETPPVLVHEWPWRFRIASFGNFEILKDDKPLGVFARVQQKPLELLKGIIGMGGENVRESTLAEALWPRIDADYAHRSLTTNLHRLRKLLGEDSAVTLRHGRLSLNPALCWLDVRAFDVVSRNIESLVRETRGHAVMDDIRAHAENLLALYRGPFMISEGDNPIYVSMRERLRNRFLRCVGGLGRSLECAGAWDEAVNLYQRGIESDQLAEGLYRRLMVCYRELGRHAEAVEVFDACKRIIRAELEVEPSPETTAIYENLLREL